MLPIVTILHSIYYEILGRSDYMDTMKLFTLGR